MSELKSSVALVTGAGRGIGRMVAEALADAGAAVGLVARSGHELADAVQLIKAAGGTAEAAIADVTDPPTRIPGPPPTAARSAR